MITNHLSKNDICELDKKLTSIFFDKILHSFNFACKYEKNILLSEKKMKIKLFKDNHRFLILFYT